MLTFIIRHIRLIAASLTILPAILLGSCVNDGDDCPEVAGGDNDGAVNLQFSIITHGGLPDTGPFQSRKSRAADTSGDIAGTLYENYIGVNDLTFMLFDGERRYLQTLSADVRNVFTSPDYSVYIFHAPVDEPYFDRNINTTFDFYILALANGRSMGMTVVPSPTERQTIDSYCAALTQTANLLTEKPVTSQLMYAHHNFATQRFPMAGLQKFTVVGSELKKSTEAVPYNVSAGNKEINMLRALAKIEVIDHIDILGQFTEADEEGQNMYKRIDKVQIDGIMRAGTIVPSISEWTNIDGDETQQVDGPTIPSGSLGAWYNSPARLNNDGTLADWSDENAVIDFLNDSDARSQRDDNCPVFSCYIYEYSLAGITNSQVPPYLRVTMRGSNSGDDEKSSIIRPIRLANFENGHPVTDLPYILRNHIYRYEVMSIDSEVNLDVVWTVCPMDNVEVRIPDFE